MNYRELTDLVKNLREQLQLLKDQNRNLKGKVEEEVQARKRLENILKNNVLPNRNDIEWNEDQIYLYTNIVNLNISIKMNLLISV